MAKENQTPVVEDINEVNVTNEGEIIETETEVEETGKTMILHRKIVTSNNKKYNDLFVLVPLRGKLRPASCVLSDVKAYKSDEEGYSFLDFAFGDKDTTEVVVSVKKIKDQATGRVNRSLGLSIGFDEDGFRFSIPIKPVTSTDRELINLYAARELDIII